jgi:hypothetical protein
MLTDIEIGEVAKEATSRARNRKISLVLVVTAVIGCAIFAATKKTESSPSAYKLPCWFASSLRELRGFTLTAQ